MWRMYIYSHAASPCVFRHPPPPLPLYKPCIFYGPRAQQGAALLAPRSRAAALGLSPLTRRVLAVSRGCRMGMLLPEGYISPLSSFTYCYLYIQQ